MRFSAQRTKVTILVLLAPSLVLLLALVIGLASGGFFGAILAGLPFVIAVIAIIVRTFIAFDLDISADRIRYRTGFRTRTWKKSKVAKASFASASTGLRKFVVPKIDFCDGHSLNLRIFSSPLVNGEPNKTCRSYRDIVDLVDEVNRWAGSSDAAEPANV